MKLTYSNTYSGTYHLLQRQDRAAIFTKICINVAGILSYKQAAQIMALYEKEVMKEDTCIEQKKYM